MSIYNKISPQVTYDGLREASDKLFGEYSQVKMVELHDEYMYGRESGGSGYYLWNYAIEVELPKVKIGRRVFKNIYLQIFCGGNKDADQFTIMQRYSNIIGRQNIHPHFSGSSGTMCCSLGDTIGYIKGGRFYDALLEVVQIIGSLNTDDVYHTVNGCIVCYKTDCEELGTNRCGSCGLHVCRTHLKRCDGCGMSYCLECLAEKTFEGDDHVYTLCERDLRDGRLCKFNGREHIHRRTQYTCDTCGESFCPDHSFKCYKNRKRYCDVHSRCNSGTGYFRLSYEAVPEGEIFPLTKHCLYSEERHNGQVTPKNRFSRDMRTMDGLSKVCNDCKDNYVPQLCQQPPPVEPTSPLASDYIIVDSTSSTSSTGDARAARDYPVTEDVQW